MVEIDAAGPQQATGNAADAGHAADIANTLPGLDLERMVLPPGARMTGVPHTTGTREYLTCERGTVELAVAGERYRLAEGDVVTFRGDQRHGYHNPGAETAVAYSAIAFAPVAS